MKMYVIVLAMLAPWAAPIRADDPNSGSKFYRLLFVVQEVDGTNVINRREYDTTAATNTPGGCSIRTDSRLSLPINGTHEVTNYSLDVKIDASNLREMSSGLALSIDAVINTLSQELLPIAATDHPPIIRSSSWRSTLIVPLKRPTVIFSSDDLTSKHKMQMVLTATPIL